jgi:hypothetical protein
MSQPAPETIAIDLVAIDAESVCVPKEAVAMIRSIVQSRASSLNAKVGAVALAGAAFAILLLSHFAEPLAPLRLLSLALAAFAAWCFCDEMGMRKPLNRAGFVLFCIAVATKVQITLGIPAETVGRYHLLYASFLLLALCLWSLAFLHRQPTLKVIGALGLATGGAAILALVIGHIVVGAGAIFGVGAIVSATQGVAPTDLSFVTLIERLFGLWGYLTAWLLWRGHIQASPVAA